MRRCSWGEKRTPIQGGESCAREPHVADPLHPHVRLTGLLLERREPIRLIAEPGQFIPEPGPDLTDSHGRFRSVHESRSRPSGHGPCGSWNRAAWRHLRSSGSPDPLCCVPRSGKPSHGRVLRPGHLLWDLRLGRLPARGRKLAARTALGGRGCRRQACRGRNRYPRDRADPVHGRHVVHGGPWRAISRLALERQEARAGSLGDDHRQGGVQFAEREHRMRDDRRRHQRLRRMPECRAAERCPDGPQRPAHDLPGVPGSRILLVRG